MGLIVVGLNHKTAPVEIREKLAFNTEESTREVFKKLIKLESVGEVVIFQHVTELRYISTLKTI